MLFQEKESFVLGFLSEKHFSHYLDFMLNKEGNRVLYLSAKGNRSVTLNNQARQVLKLSTAQLKTSELCFKEFQCKKFNVSEREMEDEAFLWGEWIENNSSYSIVFAVLSVEAQECYFLLREDSQQEQQLQGER